MNKISKPNLCGIYSNYCDSIVLNSRFLAPEMDVSHTSLVNNIQKMFSTSTGSKEEFLSENFFLVYYKKGGRELTSFSMTKEGFEALMELYTDEKFQRIRWAYLNHFEEFKELKTAKEILERKSPELFAALSTHCPGKDCELYGSELEMIFSVAHPAAQVKLAAELREYNQEDPVPRLEVIESEIVDNLRVIDAGLILCGINIDDRKQKLLWCVGLV